jgi:hypothetical protein
MVNGCIAMEANNDMCGVCDRTPESVLNLDTQHDAGIEEYCLIQDNRAYGVEVDNAGHRTYENVLEFI